MSFSYLSPSSSKRKPKYGPGTDTENDEEGAGR